MTEKSSKILYLYIFLIFILGALIFVFQEKLADTFLPYKSEVAISNTSISGAAGLGLDILRDERIKSLKANAEIFDYNDLDSSQDKLLAVYASSSPTITITKMQEDGTVISTTTARAPFFRVHVGNGNPFVSIKK